MPPVKILALVSLLLLSQTAVAADNGLLSVKSKFNVMHTADRFIGVISKNGLTVTKHVKHSESAKKANIELRPTELVIFGNAAIGAPLMKCAPSIGIDLPLKLLVWQDENLQTWMTYNDLSYIADRHALPADCRDGLNKITINLLKFTTIAGGIE